MHLRQNQNNQKVSETKDFWSLRKKSLQVVCSYDNNKLILNQNYEGTILSILCFFQFNQSILINEQIFQKFSIEQIPKNFQPYIHQKTLKSILKIILDKIQNSASSLVQLINCYPIVPFILQCYVRMIGINYINNNLQIDLWGNQIQILQNYSLDIRGNLLHIIANAINTQITLNFNTKSISQVFGDDKNQRRINVVYSQHQIQAELIQRKSKQIPNFSKANNSAAKILRQNSQRQTQNQDNLSPIHENSNLKQSVSIELNNKCQKCKLLKNKCTCGKKLFSSPYHTPKSGTKFQNNYLQNSLNINLALGNKDKCKCNKIICICRK